jgi:Protein of unknown function (DUF2934)
VENAVPKGGGFIMHSHCDTADRIEIENGIFSEDEVSEGVHIEEVLQRAHQIHRDRGGLIGYDLEDWLQAERERIGKIGQRVSRSRQCNPEARLSENHIPDFKRGET